MSQVRGRWAQGPATAGLVSMAALLCLCGPSKLAAQPAEPESPANQPGTTTIRPVNVEATQRHPRRTSSQGTPVRRAPAARLPDPQRTATPQAVPATPQPPADSQDGRTGTVGVYSNSTAVATKTNTPLINIPQSVDVVTKSFIKDQSFQSVTDHALRSGRRGAPGRRQSRRAGDPRCGFERKFLRERLSR
jgi:catecholate siderophore receptor